MSKEKSEELLDESKEKKEDTKRIHWRHQREFILNVVGYNVGLGNVWRFSYLCFKNGGGAFLIPYLIVLATCGLPLLFQEIAMGQFAKKGCIGAWSIAPIMQGVGYSGILLGIYCLMYFVLLMGWCVFYMVHSFTGGPLPWSTCENAWNTENCRPVFEPNYNISTFNESSSHALDQWTENASSSTEEFWNNYVLQKTDGLHNMGSFTNWRMLLCYTFSWIVSYMCILKGIRTTGKVVYITVTVPYVMMIILFIRGVTLDGAVDGILYYVTPVPSRLLDPTVWIDAGGQVLYSLGVCYNVLYSFGSFSKFNTDCYKYSFLFVTVCCGSSIFVGFSIFSFIGHMAFVQNKNISDVAEGGPGLVFQVLPAGVSLLPMPQIWSVILFGMLIFIAIDSTFATIEGCLTSLGDIFPSIFGHQASARYRLLFCFGLFTLSLSVLFDGGIYIFEIFNNYGSSGICILWVAFFESFGIGWIYGVDKFFDNVKSMIGYYPNVCFMYCYKYITPGITLSIFLFFCARYTPLRLGNYVYPWWGNLIGWILSASVILCIPVIAVKTLVAVKGPWKEKWKKAAGGMIEKEEADMDFLESKA